MGVTCWAPKQHFEMFKVPLLSGRVPNEGPLLFCHSRSGSTERCRHGIRTGPGLRHMHPLPRQNAVAFPLFWGTTSALLIFCTKAHCRASKSLLLTWHPEIFPVPSLGRNGESTQKIPPQSKKKEVALPDASLAFCFEEGNSKIPSSSQPSTPETGCVSA